MLMEEAERIAREEHGSTKIAVISGVIYKIFNFQKKFLIKTKFKKIKY